MSKQIGTACEHVLELHPGEEGDVELQLAEDGASFAVGLAAVDPAKGSAELLLENMWGGYQMREFKRELDEWAILTPGEGGEIRATVRFGSGKHVNISSDTAAIHSLDLTDVAWQNGVLRLTFLEIA